MGRVQPKSKRKKKTNYFRLVLYCVTIIKKARNSAFKEFPEHQTNSSLILVIIYTPNFMLKFDGECGEGAGFAGLKGLVYLAR